MPVRPDNLPPDVRYADVATRWPGHRQPARTRGSGGTTPASAGGGLGSVLPLTVAAVGVALLSRRFTSGLRRRAVLAEAVADLGHRALGARQPDALLREGLRVAVEVIGADYGTAVRRLPDGALRVAQELGPQPLPPGTNLPLAPPDRSYALRVVQTGQPFVSRDLRHDPRIAPPGPLLTRGVVSGLVVPVRGAESVLGLLALHSRRRRRFSTGDVAVASALASVVATAWEQAAQRERIEHQALHDPLTGLPNRALFLNRLQHALGRRPAPGDRGEAAEVAVMLLDLDDFKGINDSHGHAAGDQLLTDIARRLRATVRPQDTIARLGGDEFGVLCDQVPDEAVAVDLAGRLQAACGQRVILAEAAVAVTASVGITWTGRPAPLVRTAGDLLVEADAALYRAKEQGRGRLQVFDDRLQHFTQRRRQQEAELHAALERNEFHLHYQPIRGSFDRHVLGIEALLRWQHPTRGSLLPAEFLPTAEHTGLVVPIGEWVLRTACEQAARWQRAGKRVDDPLWVAVNLSPRQLDDARLPEVVTTALRDTGLAEGSLALELTETAVLAGGESHQDALAQLRQAGAQLHLDDFGTGYSSLTHLTQLPIQAVKIDRSFVAGLPADRRAAALVSALIALGAELSIQVIAEGVENAEQLSALQAMHCPAVQGFLLDYPGPPPITDGRPLR